MARMYSFLVLLSCVLSLHADGPDVSPGPPEQAFLPGNPLTLECGTVTSNLMASVVWFDPNGMEVVDNDRYDLVNDDRGIQLIIHRTSNSHAGNWTCSVRVEGTGNTTGEKNVTITLIAVVPPGTPSTVMVFSTGLFWVLLTWQTPVERGEPPVIGRYIIRAATYDITLAVATTDNSTRFNVTGLLPGISYDFSVQAVTTALGVEAIGKSSSVVTGNTITTVPELTCETEPEKGGIKVSWSFTYTGGLPLTNILVDHLENGVPTDPTLVRTDDRTVLIPRLTAGTLYHPRITASTSFGSRTLDCPGITLDIGIPGIPNAPEVSRAVVGSMRVRLSTDFPGVADEEAIIFFINIAVERTGRRVKRVQENIGSYIAGESVEVTISSRTNLRIGVRYQVTAQVRNPSGTSEHSNPESFLAIRDPRSSHSSTEGIVSGISIALVGVLLILGGFGLIIFQILYYKRSLTTVQRFKVRSLRRKMG